MATFPPFGQSQELNPWDQIWRQGIPQQRVNLRPRPVQAIRDENPIVQPIDPGQIVKEEALKLLALPAEIRDKVWQELSGHEGETMPERAAADILRPGSDVGQYIQEQAAAGDRTAKNYIAGVTGSMEGILDPMNVALIPTGEIGAKVMLATGLPAMLEGGRQIAEGPEADIESSTIRALAGLAAPVGLGAAFGGASAGHFGKNLPEIDVPQSVQPVETPLSAVRGSEMAAGVDAPVSIDSLHPRLAEITQLESLLPEETRFADAERLVKNFERPETQRVQEVNLDSSQLNLKNEADIEVLHQTLQDPALQKAHRYLERVKPSLDETTFSELAGDSPTLGARKDTFGYAKDFQETTVNPTDTARYVWDILGLRGKEAADAFKSLMADTVVHENEHVASQVGHGMAGEAEKFAGLNREAQSRAAEAKRQTDAMLSGTKDDILPEDVEALRNLHHQEMEVQGGEGIQSLARLERGKDVITPEIERVSQEELTPLSGHEPIESVNVDELTPEPVEPIESISELELDIPKRLTHVSGTDVPYPLYWDEQGNPVLDINPNQPMHTNADRFAKFGDEFNPRYTFKPKFTKPVEVTDPGGGWTEKYSAELGGPSPSDLMRGDSWDPVLRYRNQFENYGDTEWMGAAQGELRNIGEELHGTPEWDKLPRYISDASPELMATIEKRLEARGIHSLTQMEDSYLVGRPDKLLEPETLNERITDTPDTGQVVSAVEAIGDLEGEYPGLERDQALKAVFNEEVTRAENESPNRIDRWRASADAARQRILLRAQELDRTIKEGGSESGAAPNIGEDIIDYSLILRHKLAQGAVDFATWTKELPEHLQEHAQRIWDSVQNYHAKASNPANMLKGKNLTKLSSEQLETFGRLKTEDVSQILKTADDPVAAAKLITRAKHPSAPPETQRLLTQRLMQEQGIKPPPGKPPKAEVQGPPAPRPQSKVQSVEDYVGLKQSLETKQELTAREFTQYRSEGRAGLDNFEADPSKYPDAEKFLGDMFDYQKAHGVPINKLADYLPHLYEGSSRDIKAYNSWLTRQVGKLGLKPGHTLARKLASYKVAEEAFGLKPKFDNLPDLLGKYRYMAEKAVADRQLFDYAKENKLISTVHKPGWQELPNFPVRHVKTAAGKPVEIKYFGEPAFAQKVNRVFQEPSTVAKILSGIASHGRNITLGAGIPGTGWNGYGLILMNRYVKSAPDIATGIGRVMHAVKDLTLTKQAGERVQGILDEIPDAIEHGLNLSTESRHWQPRDESLGTRLAAAEPFDIGRPGIQESKVGGVVLKKFTQAGEIVGTLFDRPLTERVLPLWKMIVYKQGIEDFTAQGLEPKAAKIKAAEWANNVMTGRNWQRAGSSPEAVAWSRVFFLAPDLLRSNMELGRGIGRGLLTRRGSPEAKLYRRYAKTAFTLFVAQQALSKALGGRPGWENPSGQAFSIYAGESDKDHERYIRPTLTSEDWARIPIELSASLSSGDEKKAAELLNNRASTLVNWAMHALTQRNYAGVLLSGMGIPAGRAMLNNAMEATNLGVPPQLGWGLEALKHVEPVGDLAKEYKLGRKRTPEEIFSGLLEAPVSYIKKRKKKSEPLGIFDFHQNFSKSKKGGEDEGGTEVVFK